MYTAWVSFDGFVLLYCVLSGASLLPQCDVCSRNGAVCMHCIPRPPQGALCECGYPWAQGDPVSNNWLRCEGLLADWNRGIKVQVYYRRCTNMYVLIPCMSWMPWPEYWLN